MRRGRQQEVTVAVGTSAQPVRTTAITVSSRCDDPVHSDCAADELRAPKLFGATDRDSFEGRTGGQIPGSMLRWAGCPAVITVAVAAVLLLVTGCAVFTGPSPAPGSPTRAQLEQLLRVVRVIPKRPRPGGYDRDCGSGHRCVFGPAWSEDQDAPGGHDGCDSRDNVLARQLRGIRFRPGTDNCVVVAGTLRDPYTGRSITFEKSRAREVQIDHVYPLAAAWDMGAAGWSRDMRTRFANDVVFNLLAVDGPTNMDKSDRTPSHWLPPARAYRCFYAGKYLTAAAEYRLPITAADQAVLARVARGCP